MHDDSINLLCTEEDIYGLLSSLDTSKASGPDGISAKNAQDDCRIYCTLCMQAVSHF